MNTSINNQLQIVSKSTILKVTVEGNLINTANKTFTAADLWNIQRHSMSKTMFSRRRCA
ncbi:MAG: hypothetical protein V4556_12550 [Bacteroidota bacterium]